MRIEVVTPSGSALSGTCTKAVVPTKMGEITVLPDHIPVISTLAHGRLAAVVDGDEHIFAIAGGFIEVGKESINIVAERLSARRHRYGCQEFERGQAMLMTWLSFGRRSRT